MIPARWLILGALVLGGVAGCGSSDDAPLDPGTGDNGGEGGSGGSDDTDSGTEDDGGDGGSGGGDSEPHCDDTKATGEPVTPGADGEWVWVDVPGAKCRNGSDTGFAINFNSASKNVVVYLEGGGACFNGVTCSGNPASYNQGTFNAEKGSLGGIFDRSNDANPLKDWNFVYIPYCTGDVHAGNKTGVNVPFAGEQQFVGYANIGLYLQRIVPTFADAERVLLTGVSAGGFGAAANYVQVERAFGCIPVDLLDDSGPPMAQAYVPACLQAQWREMWGFEKTILADCGKDCPNQDDYLLDFVKHIAESYGDRTHGLISSTEDETIRTFYGYGKNDCNVPLFDPLSGSVFSEGLLDAREKFSAYDNFGTYFLRGTTHTYLRGSSFYNLEINGVKLTDWVKDLLEGNATHVGPEDE